MTNDVMTRLRVNTWQRMCMPHVAHVRTSLARMISGQAPCQGHMLTVNIMYTFIHDIFFHFSCVGLSSFFMHVTWDDRRRWIS